MAFEELHRHYADPNGWRVAEDAPAVLVGLRRAGVMLALVSNWGDRLRRLLDDLGLTPLFHTLGISAEVGLEKPDARIFDLALRRVGCRADEAVHVGDDGDDDVVAALRAGVRAWHHGTDVSSFSSLAPRVREDRA